MKVSVVIPVFNGQNFITAAIESVINQSAGVSEILVIDDGSTDNTVLEVQKFPQVRYIYQSNSGVSAARNLGIEKAKGEYIAFLDHDDRFFPNKIEICMNYFNQDPQIDVVRGLFELDFDNDETKKIFSNIYRKQNGEDSLAKFQNTHGVLLGAAIFKRQILLDIGGFDVSLKLAEDVDLWLSLLRHKANICNIPEVCLYYRQHSHSMTKSNGYAALNSKSILEVLHKNVVFNREKK